MQTKSVEDLKKNKKNFTFILNIELGINKKIESKVDKHKVEKPISEIIYNLSSIDYFFLVPFLLRKACSFHHVLRKLLRHSQYYYY